jgi:hypothetical protein
MKTAPANMKTRTFPESLTISRIECPHCRRDFELSEAIMRHLTEAVDTTVSQKLAQAQAEGESRARSEMQKDVDARDKELGELRGTLKAVRDHELALLRREQSLADRETELAIEAARQLESERARIRQAEEKRLRTEYDRRTGELTDQLEATQARLASAEKAERDLRQRHTEVEARERALALEIERKLDDLRPAITEEARVEAAARQAVEIERRELEIRRLHEQIAALQHSAATSQEAQGEAQEAVLRDRLAQTCRMDEITDVPKGRSGGDIVHVVCNASGQSVGRIIWESKNAKTWSPGWVTKLKADQRDAQADVAVIVTRSLPKGITHFGITDGVFVVVLEALPGMALFLRHMLLRLSAAQVESETRDSRLRRLHDVLSSTAFRLRCEAVFDSIRGMVDDLESERQASHRWFKRRAKRIELLSASASEVVGELEGGAGVPTLELEGPVGAATERDEPDEQTDGGGRRRERPIRNANESERRS